MKKIIALILVPFFCIASEQPILFKSSCGEEDYIIKSYCRANDLRDDQDKLDNPICKEQTLIIGDKNVSLSYFTNFATRTASDGKKVSMMNYVFYGASCNNNKIILSGSGGCNACGELFKKFNLKGDVVNDSNETEDLEPMKDIIPFIPKSE